MNRLRDRAALVLGAGSVAPGWGNGKAISVLFAREGASVFAVDRDEAAARETAGIIVGEGGHAAESVRHRIREMIDAEPVPRVLSDDRIAVLLRESGIVIARRTIAKYRESLNIPSSVQRRRLKSARL